jgi:Zn-dependent M28 family amino/carboxypeptidase
MHRLKRILILALVACLADAAPLYSGARALEHTRKIVEFGPRRANSKAIASARAYILSQIKLTGGQIIPDSFAATTSFGSVPMQNIILKFPGTSGQAVVFTGHYDTKSIAGSDFTGANDGGSSAGVLLELANTLAKQPRRHDVYLVWFDGEEAFGDWSATDSLYGSRHLAERWTKEGILPRIKALINVDMIGDKDLVIRQDSNSDAGLNRIIWSAARALGYTKNFAGGSIAIDDDHMPFVRRGVPAADLIDFDFGPDNSYWHNNQDTMDKLSAGSMEAVGRVLVETLVRLEK